MVHPPDTGRHGFAPEDPDGDALAHAIDALHASRDGVLVFDEQHVKVRFVTSNESGRIVMSAPEAVLEIVDAVLHVPEDSAEGLQLLLTLSALGECAATDRWRVFHGKPDRAVWVQGDIESSRMGPWVFEGEALTQPNILIHDEPALVRELNADRDGLRAICLAGGHTVDAPVAVGVHHHGVHIRVQFGVVYVPFPQPATDADHARRILRHMRERSA